MLIRGLSVVGPHVLRSRPANRSGRCMLQEARLFCDGNEEEIHAVGTGSAQVLVASVQDDALNHEGEGMRRSVFCASRPPPH